MSYYQRSFLQENLKKGKIVIKTHKDSETGKFDCRILGEIFVNGININMKMCSKDSLKQLNITDKVKTI